MKRKTLMMIAAITVVLIITVGAAQPGTDGDPLVTKSYIDSVVYPYINSTTKFQVVNVPANKSVICDAGTEIIVRMGTCTVIGTQKGGMSDVTMGYDLANATTVQGNHLLIAPLNDGRGVWTATDCILMIKGGYTIR